MSDNPEWSYFWLRAMAGTGKTTIAKSFAIEMANKGCLGASFFIRRTQELTRNPCHIVQTLAFDMANLGYRRMNTLSAILRDQPQVVTMPLKDQIDWLITKPFELSPSDETLVMIIDGIDEAERPLSWEAGHGIYHAGADLLVKLASALSRHSIRLFFTSRNEPDIARELSSVKYYLVDLHDHRRSTNSSDLKIYYAMHLDEISKQTGIGIDWRSKIDLPLLLQQTGTLFIYAATIVRILQNTRRNWVKKLISLMEAGHGLHSSTSTPNLLSELYQHVLENAVKDRIGNVQHEVCVTIRRVLVCVAYAYDELRVNAMLELFSANNVDSDDLWDDLQGLSSVLRIPDKGSLDETISPLHESFPEFLRGYKLDHPFELPLDSCGSHAYLAEACLKIILSTARKADPFISTDNHHLAIGYSVLYCSMHMSEAKYTCNQADAMLSNFSPEYAKLNSRRGAHICESNEDDCQLNKWELIGKLWVSVIHMFLVAVSEV
jgi:hypothetical protein